MGHGAHAESKIAELEKTMAHLSTLMAHTRIGDIPSPPTDTSSPSNGPATRASPPHLTRPGQNGPSLNLNDLPSGSLDPQPLEPQESTESRKRCASGMVGDRAVKALKLEPRDEAPTQLTFPFSPPPSGGSNNAMDPPTTSGSFTSQHSSSTPASRPSSSSGARHQMNVFQPQQMSNSIPMHFPPAPLNLSSAVPRQQPMDYQSPPQSAPPLQQTALSPFGHPPQPSGTWSATAAAFAPQHTLPVQQMNPGMGISMKDVVMASGPQTYPLPAVFDSPPLAHNQEVVLPSSSAVPPSLRQQGVPRISRSGSMSNQQAPDPFAFGLADIPQREEWPDYRQSRPTTAISLGQPNGDSSPDSYQDDDDYDGSPDYQGFRGRVGSMDNGGDMYSRPGTSSHRGTLTSQPSMENFGLLSGGHGNEVPQEYRAEVDRIFFEFLNRICSNREWSRDLFRSEQLYSSIACS